MNVKRIINSSVAIVGLLLIGYSYLAKESNSLPKISFSNSAPINSEPWMIKSVYDGDSLRLVRGNEELKIRLCGIDSPELDQPLGIESRDYLRTRGTSEPLAHCSW
jgi:endonuclease YncB( thermonuclease family)